MNDLTAPPEMAELELRLRTVTPSGTQLQHRLSPHHPWSEITGAITLDPGRASSARLKILVDSPVPGWTLTLEHDSSIVTGTTTAHGFTGPVVDTSEIAGTYVLTLFTSVRAAFAFEVVVSSSTAGIDFTDPDPTPPPPPPAQ